MAQQVSRRTFLSTVARCSAAIVLGVASVTALLGSEASAAEPQPPQDGRYNVLFIAIDDLRPELGCYGVSRVKTPNIDALAAQGTLFNRAYCQQAVCSPSRTSLLTGLRPDTTRIYDLKTHFRKNVPDAVTLPQHFKQNGYESISLGKIYHGGPLDDKPSWSQPGWDPDTTKYKDVPAWQALDVEDTDLPDGKVARAATKHLQRLKDKPFFLALGFRKPHLPFEAPRKYFDMYADAEFDLPANREAPKDVPQIALTDSGELRKYSDIPKVGPVSDEQAKDLIRAYCATTTYVDAQVGKVMDELDRLGLRERTIVVLWGDHGWHLGEQSLWCKHTNFEIANRSPLIISVPGQKQRGAKTDALVEFVDVYPTLAAAAGLPIPATLEGSSFLPVVEDPQRPWKRAAFSQYPRGENMGYSMRTDRYRYTEWQTPSKDVIARELYDHENDSGETVNLAGRAEHAELVSQLGRQLREGWQAALPQ